MREIEADLSVLGHFLSMDYRGGRWFIPAAEASVRKGIHEWLEETFPDVRKRSAYKPQGPASLPEQKMTLMRCPRGFVRSSCYTKEHTRCRVSAHERDGKPVYTQYCHACGDVEYCTARQSLRDRDKSAILEVPAHNGIIIGTGKAGRQTVVEQKWPVKGRPYRRIVDLEDVERFVQSSDFRDGAKAFCPARTKKELQTKWTHIMSMDPQIRAKKVFCVDGLTLPEDEQVEYVYRCDVCKHFSPCYYIQTIDEDTPIQTSLYEGGCETTTCPDFGWGPEYIADDDDYFRCVRSPNGILISK